ncbi:MAG TPA: MotA/TolQ/ExbB proton channel family protein [Pirellulales bacterium]|nr:MotA/TolQ/ExbB proton channel family protein [Pirellulales bacterium]
MIDRVTAAVSRSSLMWGLIASAAFYIPLYKGIWKDEFVQRYCGANWLECVEVGLFFVGLASLLIKLLELLTQSAGLSKSLLPAPEIAATPTAAMSPLAQASTLLASLQTLPPGEQRRYLPRRLRDALRAIVLKGSADGLGEELKYLSEADAMQAQASQSAVRVIIWAIPILGILGTVIGIARVTAQVDAQTIDEGLPSVMEGLGIAFDGTALGLGLSIALVFLQSFVERLNYRFMAAVDSRAVEELAGRFETSRLTAPAQMGGEGWQRLEPVLKDLLRVTKAQHDELLKLGPRLVEAAATSRAGFDVSNSPEVAVRAIAEQPEQAVVALVQAIYQFNLDVARLEQELPAPLSFAGACDLLPVRLGPPETTKRVRRKRLIERRSAA